MEEFWKSKRAKVFAAVIVLLFGMMFYSAFGEGEASFPEKVLSYVTVPVQKITAAASNGISGFLERFAKYDQLEEENRRLQGQVDQLRQELVDYESIQKENEQLRNILGMKEENPDYQFVQASVIGRDPDHRYEAFTIDQGTLHGVALHDPVVTSSGLVGWVEEVGPTYSVVTTLLSPKIKIGAYEAQSGQLGVVSGDLSLAEKGQCNMQYMEQRAKVNGIIATSGSSGIYPKGIVIGTVREIKQENGGASYCAMIESANDVSKLTTVFVITDFLGQGTSAPGK